jgi:hypothetical protein
LEESVVRGIEFCSMLAAVATIETEETRINDRMLKNIMYYRSAYDWKKRTNSAKMKNKILSTQFFLCKVYIYIGRFIQL